MHINGTDNIRPDPLGRWPAPLTTIRRIVHVPELPSSSTADFEWPTAIDLYKAQQKAPEDARPPPETRQRRQFVKDRNECYLDPIRSNRYAVTFVRDRTHRPRGASRSYSHNSGAAGLLCMAHPQAERLRFHLRLYPPPLNSRRGSMPRPFGPSFFGTTPDDLLRFEYI